MNGDHAAAAEGYHMILMTQVRLYGKSAVPALETVLALGHALHSSGQHTQAEAILEEWLPSMESMLGKDNTVTRHCAALLATLSGD